MIRFEVNSYGQLIINRYCIVV